MGMKLISIGLLICLFTGCLYPESYFEIQADRLPVWAICNADSVRNYQFRVADNYQFLAQRYLVKANEKGIPASKKIIYLKKSLSLYPEREIYFLLGVELINQGRHEEALQVFQFLVTEKNGYQSKDPVHQLMLRYLNRKDEPGIFGEDEKNLLKQWIKNDIHN